MSIANHGAAAPSAIPFFGARRLARQLMEERDVARGQLERIAGMARALVDETKALRAQLDTLGALSVIELEARKVELQKEVARLTEQSSLKKIEMTAAVEALNQQLSKAKKAIVETDEAALLQEVGVYQYRHPLADAVAYEKRLKQIEADIKRMTMKDGGAILAATNWTVNGSASEGRAMIRDFSKLMLRAFNAEADDLVRTLKPYKLESALDRLNKVADVIARLGKRMDIHISRTYLQVRGRELELTADFLQKQAEEKELERRERERLREERKVQQEIERERARLEKEKRHHENALAALVDKGDSEAAARVQEELSKIEEGMKDVDFRAANTRAGYVYVISNVGSFGERIIKIGMTRRLDPYERIRELSDASVPFNFDVHAVHFSKDAVGIETAMHERLASTRVNIVNQRREFFYATPSDAKKHLGELTGELLEFSEVAEAIEYRQCVRVRGTNLSMTT